MSLMQTLGKDVSADIVEDLMMILDTDGNGTVDFLVPNCTLSGLLLQEFLRGMDRMNQVFKSLAPLPTKQ